MTAASDVLAVEVSEGTDELAAQWQVEKRFEPSWPRDHGTSRV